MAGPSLSGPLSGWTSQSLAPKTAALPISPAAAARVNSPPGWGSIPIGETVDARSAAIHQRLREKFEREIPELEKAGDQKSLEKALGFRHSLSLLKKEGDPWREPEGPNALERFQKTVSTFRVAHPEYKLTPQQSRTMLLNPSAFGIAPPVTPTPIAAPPPPATAAGTGKPTPIGVDGMGNPIYGSYGNDTIGYHTDPTTGKMIRDDGAPTDSLTKQVLQFGNTGGGPSLSGPSQVVLPPPTGAPAPVPVVAPAPVPTAPSAFLRGGGGSDLSQYDLKPTDYGGGLGSDPRKPTQAMTPLERLLAQIMPDAAAGAPADPFANPRPAGQAPTVFENVLASLFGQTGASSGGGYTPAPSLTAPTPTGPGPGAAIAGGIPGAPPFLAGALNGIFGFGQQPVMQPAPAPGRGFDAVGIAQLSAEQRIQAAQLAKDKAAAQAKWFASQATQEQMRADQANMSRLKGFSGGGFTPAMPTY